MPPLLPLLLSWLQFLLQRCVLTPQAGDFGLQRRALIGNRLASPAGIASAALRHLAGCGCPAAALRSCRCAPFGPSIPARHRASGSAFSWSRQTTGTAFPTVSWRHTELRVTSVVTLGRGAWGRLSFFAQLHGRKIVAVNRAQRLRTLTTPRGGSARAWRALAG
jgi:hypothetical protein